MNREKGTSVWRIGEVYNHPRRKKKKHFRLLRHGRTATTDLGQKSGNYSRKEKFPNPISIK